MEPLSQETRKVIVAEIEKWRARGLITPQQAQTLSRLYNFDFAPPTAPAPIAPSPASPTPPPQPAAPRPTLMQTLTSETSIKVWLYLGAFFVIASALILSALVEMLRLPILVMVTGAFGIGALALKKRLPQPSFTLWIVASSTWLISAAVLYDTISPQAPWGDIYWMATLLITALVWSFSTWLYRSRFFSIAAFLALATSAFAFADIFETSSSLYFACLSATLVIGVAASATLKRWQSQQFALPLFVLLHIMGFILLSFGGAGTLSSAFDTTIFTGAAWFWAILFWVLLVAFYVLSDLVIPFALFPFLAAMALTPLAWLGLSLALNLLQITNAPLWVFACVWLGWALVLALSGELAHTLGNEKLKRYALPLTLFSLPLFFVGSLWDLENAALVCALSAFSAIVLTLLHTRRSSWLVWSTALPLWIIAYINLWRTPFLDALDINGLYLATGLYTMLALADWLRRGDFVSLPAWRWPLRAFFLLSSGATALAALALGFEDATPTSIAFFTMAFIYLIYGLRFNQPVVGVGFTVFLLVSINTTVITFTAYALAVAVLAWLYFGTGLLMHRMQFPIGWARLFRWSGLLTGLIAVIAALVEGGQWNWLYMAAIAMMYIVESFAHNHWAELGAHGLLAATFATFIFQNNQHWLYALAGAGTLPLQLDFIYKRFTVHARPWRVVVLLGAGFLVALTALLTFIVPAQPAFITSITVGVSLLALALLHRQARIGYAYILYLALIVFHALRFAEAAYWSPVLIALSALIYGLSWLDKPAGWSAVRRYGGLALATATALSTIVEDSGMIASVAPTIAAALWTIEAFRRRNVWLGFPANALYLMAYFIILVELNVDQPQFFSVGAAMLGMLMHYLLMRTGSTTGAFITGMLSQLVLLSTTYIQMLSTNSLAYFAALFFQSLVVMAYGLVIRSRSLTFTPIVFVVLGVVTVIFSVLKGIATVILIGCTGVLFILLGIAAVLMRERISELRDRLNDWKA